MYSISGGGEWGGGGETQPEKPRGYLQPGGGGERTLTPVGAAPQVSDDLVDLVHLHAVEFHDGSETKINPNTQNQSRWRCVMLD